MDTLKNKIALITGGNSGIGYATAKLFKEQGAQVIITGRREEAVKQAAAELGVTGFVANQAKVADTEALVQQVKAQFGRVDILFVNAGISKLFAIEEATEEGFDEMMDINFKGAYFTLSRFIPMLPDGASVIFLSSIVSRKELATSSIYSASKAALNSIMKTAALELASRKIRVNAVSPGPVKTSIMSKSGLSADILDSINSSLPTRIPLLRMGESAEVAELVAFLAGDSSKFITGSEFTIDGGYTLL
jgi:NAD(P)-dependent dehydrogenase (short-subunit alcohol dehydrogenase family)